jgi:hypothetical protein
MLCETSESEIVVDGDAFYRKRGNPGVGGLE